MGRLTDALSEHVRIGLDTSIFIYHLERHPHYFPLTQELLSGIEGGRWAALTSTVALMELNVRPWQLNRPEIARDYEAALADFPNLTMIDVTRRIARQAAQLRAAHRLRPADALHIATALAHEATAFVTNDRDFARLKMPSIVILSDFVDEA